jgi:hypothetical protein
MPSVTTPAYGRASTPRCATPRRSAILLPLRWRHVRGLPSGGCGDSSAEREFPSDKVYRRDDRGIVGVESFIA